MRKIFLFIIFSFRLCSPEKKEAKRLLSPASALARHFNFRTFMHNERGNLALENVFSLSLSIEKLRGKNIKYNGADASRKKKNFSSFRFFTISTAPPFESVLIFFFLFFANYMRKERGIRATLETTKGMKSGEESSN